MYAPYPITNAQLYPCIAQFPVRSHMQNGPPHCSSTKNEYFVEVLDTCHQIHAPLFNKDEYIQKGKVAIQSSDWQIHKKNDENETKNQ